MEAATDFISPAARGIRRRRGLRRDDSLSSGGLLFSGVVGFAQVRNSAVSRSIGRRIVGSFGREEIQTPHP
jgi:hypothetical protein